MKRTMEKRFYEEQEEMKYSFKLQIEDKEQSVKEIATENGIMAKQILLMKSEQEKLIMEQKLLIEDAGLKQTKINIYAEEIEMLKRELDEKECVISDKDKLIIQLTKQNDAFNKDIKFRDTTVDALIQKIEPKEKEIKYKEHLLEKKNSEIFEILHLVAQKGKEINQLSKKLSVTEKTIKKQNLEYKKIKIYLRKLRFELHTAATFAFQPLKLKNKILEMSGKYLRKYDEDIEVDTAVFNEVNRQRARMESIIKKLETRLSFNKPVVRYVHTPHRAVQQLLSGYNHMLIELEELRKEKEVPYDRLMYYYKIEPDGAFLSIDTRIGIASASPGGEGGLGEVGPVLSGLWRKQVRRMYRVNFYESTCLRCDQTVYQVDRVGPLKDFTFFHSGCFKCAVCGTKLTLKTYYNNQHRQEDKEVYCSGHVPKIGPGHLDGSAVGIRSALNVPKTSLFVNEQIRSTNGSTVAPAAPQIDQYQYGRFDASALHIAHALRATEIHRAYNKAREKPIEYYLVSTVKSI
ncbi:unnamed protein product [Nezara viridula]|uniref:LIM zinc-binding domain-containing protein n=1 Tax=Nezara viridula TaxID=85310 RepID=A0A9P0E2J2_NEZVI|nr:unnamed protein product [Nezara viridula]